MIHASRYSHKPLWPGRKTCICHQLITEHELTRLNSRRTVLQDSSLYRPCQSRARWPGSKENHITGSIVERHPSHGDQHDQAGRTGSRLSGRPSDENTRAVQIWCAFAKMDGRCFGRYMSTIGSDASARKCDILADPDATERLPGTLFLCTQTFSTLR